MHSGIKGLGLAHTLEYCARKSAYKLIFYIESVIILTMGPLWQDIYIERVQRMALWLLKYDDKAKEWMGK